jgi:hypothetical protein
VRSAEAGVTSFGNRCIPEPTIFGIAIVSRITSTILGTALVSRIISTNGRQPQPKFQLMEFDLRAFLPTSRPQCRVCDIVVINTHFALEPLQKSPRAGINGQGGDADRFAIIGRLYEANRARFGELKYCAKLSSSPGTMTSAVLANGRLTSDLPSF